MVLIRYTLYFVGVALVTWLLAYSEISAPGGLKLHVFAGPGDTLGTSEYSPVEWVQHAMLAVCELLLLWVARNCPPQRPVAISFGALALIFLVLLAKDVLHACAWPNPTGDGTSFGISVGTLVLAANTTLLTLYTFSCHSLRHLVGGRPISFSVFLQHS